MGVGWVRLRGGRYGTGEKGLGFHDQLEAMKTISVEVQSDHLERLAKVGNPLVAISELVWNSLDADARNVRVELDRNSLGGIETIRVRDDGCGFSDAEAEEAFRGLGGSRKRVQRRTSAGRLIHGKLGKERFRAFALGHRVIWRTRFQDGGQIREFSIAGNLSGIKTFVLSDVVAVSGHRPGTTVQISEMLKSFPLLNSDRSLQILAEEFALYLRQYPDITIVFDGRKVDPNSIELRVVDYGLGEIEVEEGRLVGANLTIIEWAIETERALYL